MGTMTIKETEAAYVENVRARVEPLLRRAVAVQREAKRLSLTPPAGVGAGERAAFHVEHGKDTTRGYVSVEIIGSDPKYPGYYGYRDDGTGRPDGDPSKPRTFAEYLDTSWHGYAGLTDTTDGPALAAAVGVEIEKLRATARTLETWLIAAQRAAKLTREALVASVAE